MTKEKEEPVADNSVSDMYNKKFSIVTCPDCRRLYNQKTEPECPFCSIPHKPTGEK